MRQITLHQDKHTCVIIKRVMTITHAAFYRLLPVVFEDRCFTKDNQSTLSDCGDGTIKIKLAPEQNRRLGSLDLPVTEISFQFENVSDVDRKRLLERFDQVYQKGGG